MFDLFGFKRRRKERYEEFIKNLSKQSDEYLFSGLSCLDMQYMEGIEDEYTITKLNAIEVELTKRGYVDDMGHIIPPKQFY